MRPSAPVQLQQLPLNLVFAPGSWQGYDRFEVWRSRLTPEGPYEALHGDTWAPASLPLGFDGQPNDVGATALVGGLDLQFLVMNQFPVSLVLPSSGAITLAAVAAAIAAQAGNLLFSYPSGETFVVQTRRVGAVTVLQCTGGEAAPLLGLATTGFQSIAYGQDARIPLVNGQTQYSFADPYGSPTFFYQTRFFNSSTRLASGFSLPFQGPNAPAFSSDNLVSCFVQLVDASGNPSVNQEVLIGVSDTQGLLVSGNTILGNNTKLLTDSTGRAQILLTRGIKVTVAIGGTGLARRVTIPDDPCVTSLNLLDPSVGSDDLFTVQAPVLDFAVRRSF
jgi:hypothetical protein